MRRALVSALVLVSLFAFGCSTTRRATIVSTRNVELGARHEVVAPAATAGDFRLWLLFIPLGGLKHPIALVSKLLEKHEGDYLTNVEAKTGGFSLLVLSWNTSSVKGDVHRRVDRDLERSIDLERKASGTEESTPEPGEAEEESSEP